MHPNPRQNHRVVTTEHKEKLQCQVEIYEEMGIDSMHEEDQHICKVNLDNLENWLLAIKAIRAPSMLATRKSITDSKLMAQVRRVNTIPA